MTQKRRPNRMLKEAEMVHREDPIAEETETAPEPNPEGGMRPVGRRWPCKFCGGESDVLRTGETYETVQHPQKNVRWRLHKCRECGRTFRSQQVTYKDPPKPLDDTTDMEIFGNPIV